MSHILAFLFVSLVVSIAFPFLMKEEGKDRLLFGLKMFFGLLAFGLIAGWIAYLLP
jgi:hypothetical protein